jgi:TilS substrate C-terminal domain
LGCAWFCGPGGLATAFSLKLNEFMINQKVPKDARTRWPLLEGSQGLAWVCGLRVDERALVRGDSQRIWHVRFEREAKVALPAERVTA